MKRPDLLSGLSFFISRFNLQIAKHHEPGIMPFSNRQDRIAARPSHPRRGSVALPLHL
jgi:hypothetical protein